MKLKTESFGFHDYFMNEMCVSVLQANEMALDRVRFGTFRCEKSSTFYTLTRDFATHSFGD